MSEPSVVFDNVSKRFSRAKRVRALADWVIGLPRRLLARRDREGLLPHEFWAVRELSFSVRPGEMLGILGPNGAGKSTVLKLLYRILRPDAGSVRVKGRVGGLIELGAGFHPYLTGRENVFINGSILGMTIKQTRERYGAIVDFAGLSEFMDMPVKDYSSGMYARLAFAIAAHAQPDVLLVDEVLAVGDASFQLKCYDWMARMRRSGRAVVNVSHDMNVMNACTHCICLDQGRAAHQGEPRKVIQAYLGMMQAKGADIAWESSAVHDTRGVPRVEVTQVEFVDSEGGAVGQVLPGADLTIRIGYRAVKAVQSPIFALALFHDDLRIPLNLPRHCLFQAFSGGAFRGATLIGAGEAEVRVHGLNLPIGAYRAKVSIYEGDVATPLFVRDGAGRIEVLRPSESDGQALIDHRQSWQIRQGAEAAAP